MKNKKFLITIFTIVLITVGGYAYLGGFKKPEIKEITTSEIFVVGKPYQGSVKSEEFGNLFRQADKLLEEKTLTGELGNIFYNDPEKQKDTINAFIGIVVTNPKTTLPAGYEIRTVPAGQKAIQGAVSAHYLLSPNKLYPAIFDFAKEKKLSLQEYYIERFPDSWQAEVIVLQK